MESIIKNESLRQKLADLRAHMAGLNLPKTGWNNHAGFAYYELGDFLPDALKKMAELKIIGTTDFKSDPEYNILIINDCEDETQQPICFYTEKSKATIQGAQPIQNIGGSHTFHRRYLWIDALELSEPDSIDAGIIRKKQEGGSGQGPQESKWINKQEEQKIIALASVAEIEAEVKKIIDAGRMIGSDRITRIEKRKAELKAKETVYVTLAQMQEMLKITDPILLKDKKDKYVAQGLKFTQVQGDQLTAHFENISQKTDKKE